LEEEVEDMEDRIVGLDDKVEELTEAMSAMKKEAEEMNADGWKIIKENKELKDEVIEERKKTIEANEKCVKMIETLPNDMDEYSWDIKQELWVHQDESSEEEEEEEEEESWYGPHRICAGRSGESSEEVEMSADEWKTIDAELDRVARTMWDDKESA
jgi:chromosome segregation ATPase